MVYKHDYDKILSSRHVVYALKNTHLSISHTVYWINRLRINNLWRAKPRTEKGVSCFYFPLICIIAIVVFERLWTKLKLTRWFIRLTEGKVGMQMRIRRNIQKYYYNIFFSMSLITRNSLFEQCISLKKINAKHNCRTQPSTCISKLILDWHRDVCLSSS